jgi:hypothetical protein
MGTFTSLRPVFDDDPIVFCDTETFIRSLILVTWIAPSPEGFGKGKGIFYPETRVVILL